MPKSRSQNRGKRSNAGSVLMVMGIIGFLVSALYIWRFSPTWSVAFGIVFACMVLASLQDVARSAEADA